MKFFTGDIIYLYNIIEQISKKDEVEKAPIDIKFLLVRNFRILKPIWEDFMETRRELLITNSSSSEDNPEKREATPEQLEYINKEIAKLEKVEIDVQIVPIPLEKLEPLNLNITEIDGLYPIILNEEA